MADRRHKDVQWLVADENGVVYNGVNAATLAVLMDLRDELKRLNAVLTCPNFIGIPAILRQIRTNTSLPKKKEGRTKVRRHAPRGER